MNTDRFGEPVRAPVSVALLSRDPLITERMSSRGKTGATSRDWGEWVRTEVREDHVYLVPVRIFIGLFWLRGFAEKITNPGWLDGTSLTRFLTNQLEAGNMAFPAYEALVTQVILPHASTFGLLTVIGELLVGLAILAGCLTNAALLGGLFMNANFLLAGAPSPSAFYIVIQLALLVTNMGASFGLDYWVGTIIRTPLVAAQPRSQHRPRAAARRQLIIVGTVALATAVYALTHVANWQLAGLDENPALIVALIASMILFWVGIAWIRSMPRLTLQR